MEFQQIRAFLEVARTRSFTRAAERMYLTQPAVSMAVKSLEEELGVDLFDRTTRRPALTPAGSLLMEESVPLLHSWTQLGESLSALVGGEPRGPLRIGAGEAVIQYLLPGPIGRFRKHFPKVEIRIRHQSLKESIQGLRAGDIDFAIRSLSRVPRGLKFKTLLRSDRVLIAPKGHPLKRFKRITLKRLSEYPFVVPWEASSTRRLIEQQMTRAGLRMRVALEAGRWEIIKRYVSLGMGVGVVPGIAVDGAERKGLEAFPVRYLFGRDRYGVLTREGQKLGRAPEEFLGALEGW